jgi:hypothetical protein
MAKKNNNNNSNGDHPAGAPNPYAGRELTEAERDSYSKLVGAINNMDVITGAFTQQEVVTAVQMLVDPGDATDLLTLAMRGDFEDMILLKAIARHLSKALKYNNIDALRELKFIVAGMVAIKGKRSDMLVQAVIGEKKQQEGQSFGDKFKRALGIKDK